MTRPVAVAVALLAASLAASGCRNEADERLGLQEKHGGAVAVDALARPGELEKAAGLPSAEVARQLGSYRLVQKGHLELSRAGKKDVFDESWRLEVDAKGNTHLLRENSRGDGMETWAVDGSVYTRPGHGPPARRATEGDEVERLRDGAQRVLASHLAVLGRFIERRDAGTATVAGRAARKLALSLASSPAASRDETPEHAWRRAMTVSALDGEVAVDAGGGALLQGRMDARYSAPGGPAPEGIGEKPVEVHLTWEAGVEAAGELAALTPPEGAMPLGPRARPLQDRQQLLDGLVAGVRGRAAGRGSE